MVISMRMKKEELVYTEIKNRFLDTDQSIIIDEKRKGESILLLQKEIAGKQIGIQGSRARILWNQLRYMDKTVIWIHIAVCIVLLLITVVIDEGGIDVKDIIFISMTLSGILGVVTIAEISRIFFSGIAELSESCYFNVKQMVALQMTISGIINLTVLLIGILLVGFQWKMNLLQIGLYVLVPFVMAQCCCLRVLLSEVGRKNSYLLIMVGIFLVIFYMMLASIPGLYQITALSFWGIAFVIGLLLLGAQIKILFRGIEEGEIICTN